MIEPGNAEHADNVMHRSMRAMSWSYLGVAVTVVLQTATSISLARLLGAQVMGVFTFGLMLSPPFRFICDFGLGSALVETKVLGTNAIQQAFARSVMLTVISSASWLVCIRLLAASVHEEAYVAELGCFALVLLSLPLQTICTAILTKELEQKYLQVSSTIAYAVGYSAVGLYGAMHDWGLWSLVLGFAAQNLIATAMLLARTRMKLALDFSGDAHRLWSFGSRATAINFSNWLAGSLDNMAVAWFFGTRLLGIYSVTYMLVRTPADKLVTTLQSILFPASVMVRDDAARLRRGCVAAIDAVFAVTAPTFCAIAVLAPTIIEALYGKSWREASNVLPPLALSMIPYCLSVIISAILWGSGGVSRDMRLQWSSTAALLVGVVIAGRYSLVAVAWIVLPVTLLRALWGGDALKRTVGIQVRQMMRGLIAGALLTALIVPVLAGLDVELGAHAFSALPRFLSEALVGSALWLGLVGFTYRWILTAELQAGVRSLRKIFAGGGRDDPT